jgi:hypothetical protein
MPFVLGLVLQEACLGLSPLLEVLDTTVPSELSPNAFAAFQAQVSAFRCWRHPPSSDSCRAVGEHLCAAWRVHTSAIESRFLVAAGLIFGWPAFKIACLRPCFAQVPLALAYEALLRLTRLDAKVDHLASLVPDLLAVWPPARAEPGCLAQVGLETLLVVVDLLGEAGAPLARYARTEEHSLRIFLWLRRLGAALLHSTPSLQHLACSRTFLAVLRALRRIRTASLESMSALAVGQASELCPLLDDLGVVLGADPAVLAREELASLLQSP